MGAGVAVVLKILFIFYFMGLSECMSGYQVHTVPREAKRGCQILRARVIELYTAMWELGIEPRPTGRAAASVLNHRPALR